MQTPYDLVISVVLFAVFIVVLFIHERKSQKREKELHEQSEEVVLPAAKVADKLHKKKFGKSSEEIEEAFPELRVIKGAKQAKKA